jgi:hypothetical protein
MTNFVGMEPFTLFDGKIGQFFQLFLLFDIN